MTLPLVITIYSYNVQLKDEYERANDQYEHLLKLFMLKEKMYQIDDSLISEIRRYANPPPAVKTVMRAVFMLLGEPPSITDVSIALNYPIHQKGSNEKKIMKAGPEQIYVLKRFEF